MMEKPSTQMYEMERLLNHSVHGVHALFDNESVRRILSKPTEDLDFFTDKTIDRVQKLFTAISKKRSLAEKKAFLHSLDDTSYEIVVRAYFHIVETTLRASLRH